MGSFAKASRVIPEVNCRAYSACSTMSASTLAAVRRRSEGTDRLGEDALAQVAV
jgi:hypothetical protein